MSLIVKNLLTLGGSQLASWLVSLLLILVLPHYLGDVAYGRLTFATSFIGLFGLVASLGANQLITKETARNETVLGRYVLNALALQLPLAVLLALGAVTASVFMGYAIQTRWLVAIAGAGMTLTTLNATIVAGLQGRQLIQRSAVWAAVERYIYAAGMLLAVVTGQGLVALAAIGSLAGLVTLTANSLQLRRSIGCLPPITIDFWSTLVRGGFPFLIWDAALVVYATIDVTLLSLMTNDAVVGWYGLAYKLTNVPGALPALAIVALFPALSAARSHGSPTLAALANRAIRLVFFGTVPMAAGLALTAGDILPVLRYPAAFAHSIPLVRILALHVPLVALDTVIGAVIIADDRQRQWVIVGCLAAVLNPALNLFAITYTQRVFGNGAIGAAAVTVLTELFMFAGAVVLRPAGVLDALTVAFMLRCLLACVPVVGLLLIAGGWALPFQIALGVIVYTLASLLLRTLSWREAWRLSLQYLSPRHLTGVSGAS